MWLIFIKSESHASECNLQNNCYESYVYIDHWLSYINYWYNWKIYKIHAPTTRQEAIKLHFDYIKQKMPKDHIYYKSYQINEALIINHLEPLFY